MSDENQSNKDTGELEALPVSVLKAGILCVCPRCGTGRLFSGLLVVAPCCPHCGLNLEDFDPGDGPQVFVMFILGFLIAILAAFLHAALAPPAWVHFVVWSLFTLPAGLWLQRTIKGMLIAQEWRTDAHEGRLSDTEDSA